MGRRLLVVLVAVVGFLVACSDEGSPSDTTTTTTSPVPSAQELAGKSFKAGIAVGPITSPDKVMVSFASGISVNAGCNSGGGDYTIEDGRLIVESMMQTEMYCEGMMEQEAAVFGLLTSKPQISLVGDVLTLTGKNLKLELSRTGG